MTGVEYRILGPLEIRRPDGRSIGIRGETQRALLCLFLVYANETVAPDRLVEDLWRAPRPKKQLQVAITRLRRDLRVGTPDPIESSASGYRFSVAPEHLDRARFEQLAARGRSELGDGRPEHAAATLAEALALWRGPALLDVANRDFAQIEIRRLDELRVTAQENRFEAELALGRHDALISELEALLAENPLRERLAAQLMLALYRSGRQSEALGVFRGTRRTLIETLGIEPGSELQGLQDAILRHEVTAVADKAAARRVELREAERELAGGLTALQRARAKATDPRSEVGEQTTVCPFKGLAPYGADDAEFFFGRERLIAELVARLVGAPLLCIVGPSGSGKSSALRAGLLPALAAGVIPGSERWTQVIMRPGEKPSRELTRASSSLDHDHGVILAVDQFEEIFTHCTDDQERARFVEALLEIISSTERRAVLALALRADFYGRCAAYAELSRLLAANHVLVGAMTGEELRRAIEQPASRAGLPVESELVDVLVTEVEREPGALPLLSTTLLELWQQRDGKGLRLAVHERTGGVRGAVARLAEDAFARLDPSQQGIARRLMLRLAGEGEGDAVVRRRVPLDELDTEGSPEAARVLAMLIDRRLLTVSAGSVEVAHEALLREWPRLRGWLEEDADGRRLHRHVIRAARDWEEARRDPSMLYRGARLASALEWRADHEAELNDRERQFVQASRLVSRRARRRAQLAAAGAVALLLGLVAAGLIAVNERGNTQEQIRTADANRLGAQALADDGVDRSLLLARQALALHDSRVSRSNLFAALMRTPATIGVMRGDGAPLAAIATRPDGKMLAAADYDGTLYFFDPRSRRRLGKPYRAGMGIVSLRFSADGARLAVVGLGRNGGFVDLFDARTRRRIGRLFPDASPGLEIVDFEAAVFSPDSQTLLASSPELSPEVRDAPRASAITHWDARTGRRRGPPRRIVPATRVLEFTASGRQIVTLPSQRFFSPRPAEVEGSVTIRDAETLRPLRRVAVSGVVEASAPRTHLLAVGSDDGTVRLLDLRSGRIRPLRGRHDGGVTAARFSPDGRRLVSAGDDAQLIVWDVRRGTALQTLQGRPGGFTSSLAVAPDARTAYSAGSDGTILAWDLDSSRRPDRPFRTRTLEGGAVAPSRTSFAVVEEGGTARRFDLRLRGARTELRTELEAAESIAFDGRTLVAGTSDGRIGYADLRGPRATRPAEFAHADAISVLSFSSDGRWLASAGLDGLLRLQDKRRTTTARPAVLEALRDLTFSPDGTMLAATLLDERPGAGLVILSVPQLAQIARVRAPVGSKATFSRDQRTLVYGDLRGRVWFYDTRTWKARGRPLLAHAGPITSVDLSPDGRLLATTSPDGARLWDAGSRKPIGAALPGARGGWITATFLGDGNTLLALHREGGNLWDVRAASWARRACAVAGRKLTRDEWRDALPDRDYAPAC